MPLPNHKPAEHNTGGVTCADGTVNLHECELAVLAWLQDELGDDDLMYTKAKFINVDGWNVTRIGKALARLRTSDNVSLRVEKWGTDRPTTWVVSRE